ncbi:hypothetical protein [Nocardia sp. BMG51109]|uniref:hypothetical protein n=1 Tax=Nocardia sp. BMG51109 TaxID=1056816 RepID=UPI0004645F0A|nr:hypothetical protein [Nocardia sp. BMG51109]
MSAPRGNAVGLVRADLSENVADDQKAVRALAGWADLELVEGLVFDAATDMPTLRLMETVHRHQATVVIVPTAAHLGDGYRALRETGIEVLCTAAADSRGESA